MYTYLFSSPIYVEENKNSISFCVEENKNSISLHLFRSVWYSISLHNYNIVVIPVVEAIVNAFRLRAMLCSVRRGCPTFKPSQENVCPFPLRTF